MPEAISEKIVARLEAPATGNRLHYFSGSTLQGRKAPSGFAVRVTAAGTKSFVLFYRKDGKPHLDTIGRWDENARGGGFTVLRAIIAAKKRADEIQDGADPRPARTRTMEDGRKPGSRTIADLLDDFFARHVIKEAKLRSARAVESTFRRLVKPAIGNMGIYEIRRSHIVSMLDDIADDSGPVMADRTLACIRKAFNWYAARDDEFMSPVVKGMARTKPKERARNRVLTDDEIRDLWVALNGVTKPTCYARYTRFLLFTATRLNEAAKMRWDEVEGDIWTIPAARYKTKRDHVIPLTSGALELMGPRPKDIAQQPFVFSPDGGKSPLKNHQQGQQAVKRHLDAVRNGKPIARWSFHDLRRTARSTTSRVGISWDHAERCLGHVIGGVRETYDRHEYFTEKKKAFEALAAQIERILNPTDNVEDLAKRRKARV